MKCYLELIALFILKMEFETLTDPKGREHMVFNAQEINTINYLLEDLLINKQKSIIKSITDYLYFNYNPETTINILNIKGINENIKISRDLTLELLLFEDIKSKLNFLKTEIKREGE